jgi:hypothetical protein
MGVPRLSNIGSGAAEPVGGIAVFSSDAGVARVIRRGSGEAGEGGERSGSLNREKRGTAGGGGVGKGGPTG